MKSKSRAVLAFLLFTASTAFARVGQTAVVTLQMPGGAENLGMGEVGVSLADNIHSVFWNPASLPAVGDNLSVQFIRSTFRENLLPSFNIADLWHADTITAAFLQNIYRGVDIGAAYSSNFVNMGQSTNYDELGDSIGTLHSWEQVRMLSFGVRFAKIFSVGASVKQFDSHLAPGIKGADSPAGTAQGEVFDFGVRLEKKFTIAEVLDVTPALGFSISSFPQDSVDYQVADTPYKDPLELVRYDGASIKLNLLDLLGFTYAGEGEYGTVNQEYISHYGYKIQLSPVYAILRGRMVDYQGMRDDSMIGYQWTFNYQQLVTAATRVTALFNPAWSKMIERNLRSPFKLKPNFFFQYTTDTIHSPESPTSSGARHLQTRNERTFGFSLVGDIADIPPLRKLFGGSAPPSEVVIPREKDGDPVK